MLDRFGKRVVVGWAEHEVLWLKAAMTLPRIERWEAFQDISDLTGRTFAAVTYQAQRLECARQEDALKCIRRPPTKACGDGPYPAAYAAGAPIRMARPRAIAKAGEITPPTPQAGLSGHFNTDGRISSRFQPPIENGQKVVITKNAGGTTHG